MGFGARLGAMLRRATAGHEEEIAAEMARLRGLRSREEMAAYAKEKGAAAKEILKERGPQLKEALRQGWDKLLEEARGGPDRKDR